MAYQASMFDEPPQMKMAAVFDPTSDYRVELTRVWNDNLPQLVVCMLNPSTADAFKNDPTILTLIYFATLWGYGGLIVVNLYSFCSSSPVTMLSATDPIGSENRKYLQIAINYAASKTGRILVAWGSNGTDSPVLVDFIETCLARGVRLVCLGTNADGSPKHPMARGRHRIPRDQQPVPWEPI